MSANKISVLIICPSLIIARGLESIISESGNFEVCGILPDLSRTSESRLKNLNPNLIIVDPGIFDYSTRLEARSIISQFTDAPIVAIPSTVTDEQNLKQYDELINIFDEVHLIPRKLHRAMDNKVEPSKNLDEELSSREKEVLICVAKGMLNKEIADNYNISINTVITHRKNICRKTGIKTVPGLTAYALLNNLIDLNSVE